jgi:acetyl-CoA carboxylase carboxyl transferase subunit beta
VQTAENLAATGVIDGVVAVEQLPDLIDLTLGVLVDDPVAPRLPRRTGAPTAGTTAWQSIARSRLPGRAGVRDLLAYGATGTVRLRGTDEGERDSTVLVALTRLDGQPCVVVGQDRSRQEPGHEMGPGALREARRGMRLAEELGLPLVTVIDTPGAELSARAEERAIAGEIARCIATLTTMTVPTVSVLLGQGCGGGALALLPARTVVATEHGWLSPLPPEGASVIMHGDVSRAAEMAQAQRVSAVDLMADGTVHHIVPEQDDDTAEALAVAVAAEVGGRLAELTGGAREGRVAC